MEIAEQEMGHLATIQNLLRAIGGPVNFEREHFPFRTEFYPFPFTLQPVTKDSLARYVATEMPDRPDIPLTQRPVIDEILVRATRANEFVRITAWAPFTAGWRSCARTS